MNINANETLQYLSNAGIINIEQVQKDVEIMQKKMNVLKCTKKPYMAGGKEKIPAGKPVYLTEK